MDKGKILKKYKPAKENLLLILHDLQNFSEENYLSDEDIRMVSKYLNITYAEVYGVAGYYSMFSKKPRGRNIIRVCNSPVCEMTAKESFVTSLSKELGIQIGETTKDKRFTLEESECLGNCDEAPVMMINDKMYSRLDGQKLRNILNQYH